MFCVTVYRPLTLIAAGPTYVIICYWLIKNTKIMELEAWHFVLLLCLICASTLHHTFEILLNFYDCCFGFSHGIEKSLLMAVILLDSPTLFAASSHSIISSLLTTRNA